MGKFALRYCRQAAATRLGDDGNFKFKTAELKQAFLAGIWTSIDTMFSLASTLEPHSLSSALHSCCTILSVAQ
jgi:hypothetical protein